MVSYIVDESGNKTHAVVPIDEWHKIDLQKVDGLPYQKSDIEDIVSGSVVRSVLFDITMIMSHSEKDKKLAYVVNTHYKYLDEFDSKDIGLLYLFRETRFNMIMAGEISRSNEADEIIEKFCEMYTIKTLYNKNLTIEDFQKVQKIFLNTVSPKDAIKKFKLYFKIGVDGFSKRLRKDAEIKRLFFYDLSNYFTLVFPNDIKEIGELKKMMENMAESIYEKNSKESAITQMNKAIREANQRIEKDKWKAYLGI